MLKTLLTGLFLVLLTLPGVAQVAQEQSLVDSLQVSPDGKLLAVSLQKMKPRVLETTQVIQPAELQVWEMSSGRLKWSVPIQVLFYQLPEILFSPDSSMLLATNIVNTIDAPRNMPDFSPYQNSATITDPVQQAQAILWDAATGEKRNVLELTWGDRIAGLVFSPDGNELVGGIYRNGGRHSEAEPKNVHVWNRRTGKLLRRTLLGDSAPEYMAFSADGRSLQTLSPERTEHWKSRIMRWESWSWPEGVLQDSHLLTEPAPVLFVPLSPSQEMMAIRSWRARYFGVAPMYWDVESRSRKILDRDQRLIHAVDNARLLPDGKTLVLYAMGNAYIDASDGKFRYQDTLDFWDKETSKLIRNLKVGEVQKDFKRNNHHIAYTPDGKQFVVSQPTGKIELRSLEDGVLIRTFE